MKYSKFMFLRIGFIFFCLTVFLPWVYADQVSGTKGETGLGLQALSGHGENFEVVLKYATFKPGNDVSLVVYVLDIATNEPIKGAALSGNMSSGDDSLAVEFKEMKNELPGTYGGTARVKTDKPYSWLFDISLGEKSDLIAIDGFITGDGRQLPSRQTDSENKETEFEIVLTPVRIGLLIAVFICLQVVIIYYVRRKEQR